MTLSQRLFITVIVLSASVVFADGGAASSTAGATTHPVKKTAVKPTTLPVTSGEYKLKFKTQIDGHPIEMAYYLFLPKGYDTGKEHYPLLVFLHGGGEVGTDLAGIKVHGPPQELDKPCFREMCPFIVLAPQCPPHGERWDQPPIIKAVVVLIDEIIAKARVDHDRVYLTGLSMGGKGTWDVAIEAPDRFAAIAPLATEVMQPQIAPSKLRYIPIWNGRGEHDSDPGDVKKLEALFKDSRAPVRGTILPGLAHDAWDPFYQNAEFYEWLLWQHRLSESEKRSADAAGHPAAWPPESPSKATGHQMLQFTTKVGSEPVDMRYTLYLPPGYLKAKPPLILYLHEPENIAPAVALGKQFNGPLSESTLCLSGPEYELALPKTPLHNFPFIVLSPKLPPNHEWKQDSIQAALTTLIAQTVKTFNADPTRVYITGYNAGGAAAWQLARKHAGDFAAAMVISQTPFNLEQPELLTSEPLLAFVPTSDAGAFKHLADTFAQSHTDSQAGPMDKEDASHALSHYGDQRVYDWLLKHQAKGMR